MTLQEAFLITDTDFLYYNPFPIPITICKLINGTTASQFMCSGMRWYISDKKGKTLRKVEGYARDDYFLIFKIMEGRQND